MRLLRGYLLLGRWIHPSEQQVTLLWALVIGAAGGLGAIGFRAAIQGLLWLFTRHTGSLASVAEQLPWWHRLARPAVGGLLAGLTLQFGARFARGRRSTDYLEAVALGNGVIGVRQSLTKTLSSLLTIASGGSIGREGAMVQLAATIASAFGSGVRLSTPRLRLLVACGAAAGIAAVYNVTIAAALFVAEIVLGSISMESLGPLLLAAVASSLMSRYAGGVGPYFDSPQFQLVSLWEFVPYLVLGFSLGLLAPLYVRLLRRSEDLFAAVAPPLWLRLALGGLVVGVLAIGVPEVWGNGRSMVNRVLESPWPWQMLALVLVCKVVATAATTGSGAVGGVFTPTLFTGAMLGSLLGHAAHAVWPGETGAPSGYALVGMAGFLAACTRAPLMSMLMLFEMTLNYGVILPLMLVSVIAYYTARSFEPDSIYSESLRRKQSHSTPAALSALRVRDVMKPPPAAVPERAPFDEIARRFANQPYRHLLVVGLGNELRGIIALQDVEKYLQDGSPPQWITAGDLMRTRLPVLTPETGLPEAIEAFRHYDAERLPVVSEPAERRLAGYLSKTDVLLTLAHGLHGEPH